jgi:dTDP-glucose 4,6-dehydratase
MKFLVTGGAGFIGSCVVRRLVAEGEEVVTLDCLTYAGHRESLGEALTAPNHRLAEVNIRDAQGVRRVFAEERPDIVMHLAAESHVDRSIDNPLDFVTTNVLGTVTLLQAATEYWHTLASDRREVFRFLHVSTDEVYGSLGETGVFTEATPYQPNSPYSASKASSDHFARAWHHTFGLPVIISHCSNNYGPYQMPEKLIPVTVLAALEGRSIPIYGNGSNVRDWLFVEDHARALELIARKGRPGGVYNVGADEEVSNLEMVHMLCACIDEHLPASAHRPHAQLITFVEDRPGHDKRYAIDSSRVREELGWRLEQGLQDGLRRTTRWYLENRWWWQSLRDGGFKCGTRQGLSIAAE